MSGFVVHADDCGIFDWGGNCTCCAAEAELASLRQAVEKMRRVVELARLVSSQSYADPDGGWDAESTLPGHPLVHIRRQLVKDIHAAVAEYDAALPTGETKG